ncbi:hypothetical protein GBAR_LOCUS11852, partial [Geodia barretti]
PVQEDRYHETSQLILDTSLNSVYDNRLRVRGRRNGTYNCTISNNIRDYIPEAPISKVSGSKRIAGDPVTGYVIYYQPKGGPVNSHRVFAFEHLLDGLQRGVTYYISIVALSPNLPSPLVGPITVIPDPPPLHYPHNYTIVAAITSSAANISVTNTATSATTTSPFTTSRALTSSVTALTTTMAGRETTTTTYITECSTNSQVPITTTTVITMVFTGTGITPTTTPTSDMVIASPVTQMSTFAKDMEARTKTITLTTTVTSTPVSEMCACKNVDKESFTSTSVSEMCKDGYKEPPFTKSTAVIAGGVGGGIILCQILVCLPIAIFCICNRSAYSKKVETHSNTAYGMVPARRREEPVYDVINQPLSQSAVKLPLSPNVAIASTAI